jgi:sirohydrochlorin cobaltochelatase
MCHAVSQPLGDAALVIAAHGASRCGIEDEPAFQHAEALRRRSLFGRVEAGFWKREPELRAVLDRCAEPLVYIVPMFISGGYFADRVIPAALGFDLNKGGKDCRTLYKGRQCIRYCHSIGNHPTMARVIVARALEAMNPKPACILSSGKQRKDVIDPLQHPFYRLPGEMPENRSEVLDACLSSSCLPAVKASATALVIAGHGTEKHALSKAAILEQARRIRDLCLFAEVHAAFMEESPRIDQVHALVESANMVVVPFFIGEGGHVTEDIPVMLGATVIEVKKRLGAGLPAWRNPTDLHGKRIWYAEAVGGEPLLADVILARAIESGHAGPMPQGFERSQDEFSSGNI